MAIKVRRRRFAAAAEAVATKPKPKAGRCNYPLPDLAGFCRVGAGRGTDHPGSGYCRIHDQRQAPNPADRYKHITKKSLRRQMEKLTEQERDHFDLLPEIILMRALMVDYIERFLIFREALIAWYKDNRQKPPRSMDISEASNLIEAVSRLIQRHHSIQKSGSISLETFRAATEQMGIIVAKHVREGKVLAAIEADWAAVTLDTKTPGAIPLPEVSQKMLSDGEET